MTCVCGDRGLVRISYHNGTPFDIGICQCRAGQRFREKVSAVQMVARHYGVPVERVRRVEDLADDVTELTGWGIQASHAATPGDFREAGKVAEKAKM